MTWHGFCLVAWQTLICEPTHTARLSRPAMTQTACRMAEGRLLGGERVSCKKTLQQPVGIMQPPVHCAAQSVCLESSQCIPVHRHDGHGTWYDIHTAALAVTFACKRVHEMFYALDCASCQRGPFPA